MVWEDLYCDKVWQFSIFLSCMALGESYREPLLMQEVVQSPQVTQLLTRGTHHLELFAITLMQNLYPGGREQTTQNRNYHYTVLFRNPLTPVTSKRWAIVGWETVKRFGNSIKMPQRNRTATC